jgi:hypothetical protein
MYVLGTLHVPGTSLLDPVAVERLSHDAGLPQVDQRTAPTRLMRALAVPSLVLLALQLYRAGLGTQYWVVFQVRKSVFISPSAYNQPRPVPLPGRKRPRWWCRLSDGTGEGHPSSSFTNL